MPNWLGLGEDGDGDVDVNVEVVVDVYPIMSSRPPQKA